MSANESLTKFLENLKVKVQSATDRKDWGSIFTDLKSYPNPLKYNFTNCYLFLVLGLAIAATQFFLTDRGTPLAQVGSVPVEFIVYGIAGLMFLIPLIIIINANDKLSSLSDEIFNKDVFWDNNLVEISTKGKYLEYNNQFYDFQRGDQDRVIENVFKGRVKNDNHPFEYELYKFSYVKVTYRTVKVGKSTTVQRVETTYYRYGMVCEFPFVKSNIIIGEDAQSSLNHGWETSSKEFNSRVSVSADSETEIAKFLSPATVLLFTDGLNLQDMNFEFIEGKLCVSFDDEDIFSLQRKYGIENPAEFEKEINSHLALTKLKSLEEMICKLITNSDNNFK